jgi:hypothetical protein
VGTWKELGAEPVRWEIKRQQHPVSLSKSHIIGFGIFAWPIVLQSPEADLGVDLPDLYLG